ncbi:MAG: phosphatase PAP2 family protein [Acetobacteraceae bacterium]|nr:phosphatase PAP2 family protein [Acetobacteraceae bacterium]
MKQFQGEQSLGISNQPAITLAPYMAGVVASVGFFCLALFLALEPSLMDRPLAEAINAVAGQNYSLDMIFYDLDHYNLFSGTLILALIWGCWFGTDVPEEQARIFVGTLLAFPVGMLSRFLQHTLITHPRPYYDPALGFHPPLTMPAEPLNTWNSFPSDHATVFGALALVIILQRPKLTWFIVPWFVLLESARVYMGAHYPSDLIGGTALGAAAIFASRAPWFTALAAEPLRWSRSSPALFYGAAFFVTYQVSTLFSEVRFMAGGVTLLKLLKFW